MDAPPAIANTEQRDETDVASPLPLIRSMVGGVLMGLANLVPGVSGGTMILVMGLYDRFITSIADVTRLRFTRRSVAFLALVGAFAAVAIALFAGTLSRAVTLHRSAMFSLFIGLTLGGTPLLLRMVRPVTPSAGGGVAVGLLLMVTIAATQPARPDHAAVREAVAHGEFVVEEDYARDVVAGALGMSAMVLPGISGAYMLLILNRYEPILAAIALAKAYAGSMGRAGDAGAFLSVIVPTGVGALLSLVCLSNMLKWLLRHHEKTTVGVLLGILLGSVVGIWPFSAASTTTDVLVGAALAAAGFAATLLLSRVGA